MAVCTIDLLHPTYYIRSRSYWSELKIFFFNLCKPVNATSCVDLSVASFQRNILIEVKQVSRCRKIIFHKIESHGCSNKH